MDSHEVFDFTSALLDGPHTGSVRWFVRDKARYAAWTSGLKALADRHQIDMMKHLAKDGNFFSSPNVVRTLLFGGVPKDEITALKLLTIGDPPEW